MKRLALIAFLLLLAPLPAASRAAACSPLNCAPSQFALDGGRLLATRTAADAPLRVVDLRTGATRWRLPAGVVDGRTLVHQDGRLLTWYDLATGRRLLDATLAARGTYALVGGSQDGAGAVLSRTQRRSTTFAIVGARAQRSVVLGGSNWGFDALSGRHLFLIHYLRNGYQVRLYDLAANRLQRQPLKDPDGSSLIWGAPFARLASHDGRYLFTLYIGSDGGAMIHELDLRNARARCVDLAGDGDFSAAMTYALALDPSGRTLWAVSPGYGRAVAIDVARHRVTDVIRFRPRTWTSNPGAAATARDGRVAVTDAEHVWLLEPARHRVVEAATHTALALGFAPDGHRLWLLGQRSRVSAVRL